MFGVLEVVLRRDPVPGQSFGAGQGQIPFIVSLGTLSVSHLGAGAPGRFISLGGSGSSRHGVGHDLRIWAWLRRCRFKFRNVFHVGPYAAPGTPDDVHWRNCRVGRRSKGSDQALREAGSWVRHSVNNDQSWPNGSRSTELIWKVDVAISSCSLNLPWLASNTDAAFETGNGWNHKEAEAVKTSLHSAVAAGMFQRCQTETSRRLIRGRCSRLSAATARGPRTTP